MPDVFFYEAFEEEADALRARLPDGMSAGFDWRTIQEAGHAAPPAPIVSIRTQSELPLSWARQVKAVLARATGYDHLLNYRADAGIDVPCGYLPVYANRSVAEQAMLMWMALCRRLSVQQRQFGVFHRDGLTGAEVKGKTLLVVGVGNIGYEVWRIGRGLSMNVLGVDINRKHNEVQYVSIDDGLPRADVVVCAMNLTAENVGYFARARLSKAKRGAIFVNVARGEHASAIDLLKLLEEGCLGGVGLDVYLNERALAVALRRGQAPDDAESRAVLALSRRDDAILTPHNAFNTREAVARKAAQSIEQVTSFLETGEFKWSAG